MCCFNSSLLPGWLPQLESNVFPQKEHTSQHTSYQKALALARSLLTICWNESQCCSSLFSESSNREPDNTEFLAALETRKRSAVAPACHDRLKPSFRGQSASNQKRVQDIHIPQLDQDKCLLAVKLTMFPLLPPGYEKRVTSH